MYLRQALFEFGDFAVWDFRKTSRRIGGTMAIHVRIATMRGDPRQFSVASTV